MLKRGLGVVGFATCLMAVGCGQQDAMNEAMRDSARVGAVAVRNAATLAAVQNGDACPSIDDLLEGRFLDTGSDIDPWEHRYAVSCPSEGQVEARSAGPDGEMNTDDDIVER